MRIFIMVVAFSLSSCAVDKPMYSTCAPIPQMGASEQLKDYTLRIIDLYGQCARLKGAPHE